MVGNCADEHPTTISQSVMVILMVMLILILMVTVMVRMILMVRMIVGSGGRTKGKKIFAT